MITSDIKSMKTYMGPETAVNAPAETERSMGERYVRHLSSLVSHARYSRALNIQHCTAYAVCELSTRLSRTCLESILSLLTNSSLDQFSDPPLDGYWRAGFFSR